MYSKLYIITCDPQHADAMMKYYDNDIAGWVRDSSHHAGHQMVEVSGGRWVLISNYHNKHEAEAAAPKVQEIVAPMVENFGMTLEPVAEGETIREVS